MANAHADDQASAVMREILTSGRGGGAEIVLAANRIWLSDGAGNVMAEYPGDERPPAS